MLDKIVYYAARGKKFLVGLVGAIVAAGGVAVLLPSLPTEWATTVTGVVTILAVLFGPANAPKQENADDHSTP